VDRESQQEYYAELILEHYRAPRNRAPLERPTVEEFVRNPLCGDQLTLQLRLERGLIAPVSASARGCSLSVAASSMLADRAEGLSPARLRGLLASFRALLGADRSGGADRSELELGELEAFSGLRRHPVRRKCALLPVTAFERALEGLTPEVAPNPAKGPKR